MRYRVRWGVLVAVLALAVGALAGALVLPPLTPPSAASLEATRVVPAIERIFDDVHSVAATPILSNEVTVLANGVGGIVTASSCTPGTEIKTGDHLFSVDGVARIAVVTGVPLWRDLSWGARGPDVEALQTALVASGYQEVAATGTYDGDTVAAVKLLQENASVTQSGLVALDQVQWVPADVGPTSSCEAGVGTIVSSGQPLLKVGGGLVALSLPVSTTELPGRAYIAVAGDAIVAIPDDRRITDPALLQVVSGSTAFAAWVRDPAGDVAVDTRLAEPVSALGVSPSAVVLSDAGNGCVATADGAVVPVQILASELGTIFVVPDRPVATVIIPAAEVISACS